MKTYVRRAVGPCGIGGLATGSAAILVAFLLAAVSGCDSDSGSFVPPPPRPESGVPIGSGQARTERIAPRTTTTAVPAESHRLKGPAPVVELILPRPADTDRQYLIVALRHELGLIRSVFRIDEPEPGQGASPARLAGAIRSAVGRGVSGLLVEPLDDPAVADALYEADGRGVAVLLLDRPVPPRDGRTLPRVEYQAIADIGGQIAADCLEADRSYHRTRPGRAIILHHRVEDAYIDRCLAALRDPLRAAGKPIQILEFEGGEEKATEVLRRALEDDPKMDILLADDLYGLAGARTIHREWAREARPEFVFAGFAPYDNRSPELLAHVQAFGNRSVEKYATRAAKAIQSLLDGKKVDDVVGVPMTFHRKNILFVPAAKKPAEPAKK